MSSVTIFIRVSILILSCQGRLEEDTYNSSSLLRNKSISTTNLKGVVSNSSQEICKVDKCFHKTKEECPSPEGTCRCHLLKHCKHTAVCCNVNSFQLIEGLGCVSSNVNADGFVESLHIRNATLDALNMTQGFWKRLKYLTITDGHIKSIIGEFPKLTSITCLNFSSNGISKFGERSLVNLYNLNRLDLSNNNLTGVPRFKKEGQVTLDISDNGYIRCSSVLDSLKREDLYFNNENKTICLSSKTFYWFNSTEHIPLSGIRGYHELNNVCTLNCTCLPMRVDFLLGEPPIFAVSVNCSDKGFTSLPTPLPPNTIELDISNNNITSLELVNNDSSYNYLRALLADNNLITSILPLEGSKFISNFVGFSLRNNKITSLPTYMLSNMFDRTTNTRHVYLGLNKLECDCNTAKFLKVWLLTKQKEIPDYDEIYCGNMDSKVFDLYPSKLCQSQQDWTDYIYVIITFQVLLLVGLIAKVLYDYWVFKTAGYLPWPASKMPKMPCDWLCE